MNARRLFPVGAAWMLGLATLASLAVAVPVARAEAPATTKVREVRTIDGKLMPLVPDQGAATAVVFYSTECPISNAYSPTLKALREAYSTDKLALVGVCVDPDLKPGDVSKHAREFGLDFPIAQDRDGTIAARFGAKVTPEVALVDTKGQVCYLGRIDDQYARRGQRNANPKAHELRDAIDAVLQGQAVPVARAEAVGCPVPAAPAVATKPTYAHDVAPILQRSCQECHRPGQVGPFSLMTYEQARKRAEDLAEQTTERRMPPWKPDPAVGPTFAHSKALTGDEIATIAAWAQAGAPEGDANEVPPNPDYGNEWKLGTPDMVVEIPVDYPVAAQGDDVYRCFVIPSGLLEDKYVTAVDYHPGNRQVVHHILGYVDTSGNARKKDESEEGPGYMCFGGPGIETSGDLGGWAPGAEPSFLPDGIGRKLPKNSDIVIQVHYHSSGKPETDRSKLALYFSRKPIKQTLHWNAALNPAMKIPAGAPRQEIKAEWSVPVDVTAVGVVPHMHLLGRDMTISLTYPDGRNQDLIRVNDWDFNWQNQYYFEKPFDVPKGSTLKVVAHYDNTNANPRNPKNPPVDVAWGEATTDEMCIGFLAVVKKGQDLTRTGEPDDLGEIFAQQRDERRAQRVKLMKEAKEAEAARKKAKADGK